MLKSSLTDKAHPQINERIVRYHLKPEVRMHASESHAWNQDRLIAILLIEEIEFLTEPATAP